MLRCPPACWLLRGMCAEDASVLQSLATPPTPGMPHRWSKRTSLLEVENNGYT